MTKRGTKCEALAGADGLCSAHSGRTDMRAIGSKGGKGRRRGIGERLPESDEGLVEVRGLDVKLVKATAEELLAGANQTAKVAIIRLLADLAPFARDGCSVCAARKVEAPVVEASSSTCSHAPSPSGRRRSEPSCARSWPSSPSTLTWPRSRPGSSHASPSSPPVYL
jgi:hypothetical protein